MDVCVIEPNPDVTGIGIRISIYALCLTCRLLPFAVKLLSPADRRGASEFERASSAALGLQGLALLCTAIAQTAQRRLTLFHAVAVQHLLALLGVNLAARGRYRRRRRVATLDAAVAALAAAAFAAFDVYVWVKAPGFGSQPDCNGSTVYVVFGVSVGATDDVFRYVVLATFAVVPAFFVVVVLVSLPCCIAALRSLRGNRGGGGGSAWRVQGSCCGWNAPGDGSGSDDDDGDSDVESVRRRHGSDASEERPDPRISEGLRAVAYAVFSIYAIISLEQMIERNHLSEEEREWSFGQVIAIFLLGGTFYELAQVIISGIGARARSNDRNNQIELRPTSGPPP
ncbi:hypothetical protein GGTG_08448 [Gaeumannomyces tritici R3-111a-1]|uniref:Uncharacterized protein n=1 Tax=Gaeumannomyces tritici (strain R3-111a-1) TaxID=644352 RepID=J3P4L1_GAET3|nr:hypothetical protein GGTG_08448 [Gaeumannomyces tritici R3-111a-1]EJT74608.1 hypothetical protein GGTG_08448 [Gaeumannomyces tritici R3-111a-1]